MKRFLPVLLCSLGILRGGEDYVPLPTEFPPVEKGIFLSGELVLIDPINRRGAIRLDGDGNGKHNRDAPMHYFAMLPCGEIWRHGAPAALRDLPIGTHVQGIFFLPPRGEEETIPGPAEEWEDYVPDQNHALILEDDVSFHERQGRGWKVVRVDHDAKKLEIASQGGEAKKGLSGNVILDFDIGSRVWQKGRPVSMAVVKPGTLIRINFSRGINWGDSEFGVGDLWLDEESWEQARELQRLRNIAYHRVRWIPGKIDQVEEFDFGGGEVTISLFGGVARQVYDELEAAKDRRIAVAAAEPTLRTWTHRSDRVFGKLSQWESTENPPIGFSGIRLHLRFAELLDHFRPGNCVRVKSDDWIFVSNTPEERIKSRKDREDSRTLVLPEMREEEK